MKDENLDGSNCYYGSILTSNMIAIGKEKLKTLDDLTLSRLTSVDSWIDKEGDRKNSKYRVVNRYGEPISKWYKSMMSTSVNGRYAVVTFDDKFGILDVTHKTMVFD